MELPWQPISRLTPQPDGDKVWVWNGVEMGFAYWKYGWSFDDDDPVVKAAINERCWCHDYGMVMSPQPIQYLPLVPPGVDIETTFT